MPARLRSPLSGPRSALGQAIKAFPIVATCALVASLQSAWAAPEQAGVAAAVVSPVDVGGPARAQAEPVHSGMGLFMQDLISTGPEARLQLLLLDQTTFTVGANSEVTIDRFVYDPDRGVGEVAAEMTNGLMRYVSGAVGKGNPESVRIDTPAATLGIRGTAFFVTSLPDEPGRYFAGLLGPGRDNNAFARAGGFTARNEHGTTVVRRGGFGVYLTRGESPGAPVRTPAALIERVTRELRPSRVGKTAGARQAANLSEREDPRTVSGQPEAETRITTQREQVGEAIRRELVQTQEAANRRANSGRSGTADILPLPVAPSETVTVPFFAQLSWTNLSDLDLHVTGPNVGSDGRFHVFFAQPIGPPGLSGAPVAELDQDAIGPGSSEVVTVNELPAGGPTRVSVFNFADPDPGSTSLADVADAQVSLLRDGRIARGPGGSIVVEGTLLDRITPPAGKAGNTFVAYEIAPDGSITPVGEMRGVTNPLLVP